MSKKEIIGILIIGILLILGFYAAVYYSLKPSMPSHAEMELPCIKIEPPCIEMKALCTEIDNHLGTWRVENEEKVCIFLNAAEAKMVICETPKGIIEIVEKKPQ